MTRNSLILYYLLICVCIALSSCKANNSPDPGNPAEIEEFIIQAYKEEFNLNLSNPAFVYSSDFDRYTSTAYYKQSLYRIYVLDNGNVLSQKTEPIIPLGDISVLSIIVDYPNLRFGELKDNLWKDAQASINDDHKQWASKLNLSDPLLQFSNSNLLIEPGRITDPSISVLRTVANENGYNANDFDIIAFIDLDLNSPSGGFAVRKFNWVKMGWFYSEDQEGELTYEQLRGIAYGVYHHEIGHLFGWEHEWSDAKEEDLFITAPDLFGWTDIDNDGIIEILDSEPYGIKK